MAEAGARMAAVAIGRNEGARLERCLRSLVACGVPVVYVDSASTDGSVELARGLGAVVHELAMDRPFTAARARAEGYARLGEPPKYVMFVDGDCEVEAQWPARAAAFLDAEPGFAVVCGRRRERHPEASPYNRLIDAEWDTPVGEATACGGDAVFRASAYEAVGGFDPAMIAGEEPELCVRLRREGWRVMRLDAPMTIHDAAMTRLSQWWRRAYRSGIGYAQAWRQTGGALYRVQVARALFYAGLVPLSVVILAVAVHPAWLALWPLAAGVQWLRQARREGRFAAHLAVLAMYAELAGILRYVRDLLAGKAGGTVHYK
jgi:cellulose synthase/poly-beta-1,6-N-acetylglucosamine synthase-like glycosyltransferase